MSFIDIFAWFILLVLALTLVAAFVGLGMAPGYIAKKRNHPWAAPVPYHGYYFRVLTAQGDDAPGGARDFIINGRMIGGFALIATPAEYADVSLEMGSGPRLRQHLQFVINCG